MTPWRSGAGRKSHSDGAEDDIHRPSATSTSVQVTSAWIPWVASFAALSTTGGKHRRIRGMGVAK
eukprot:CAMPEP_0183576522 /NCGR_PEP_ID=MMETSP0371-20130417/137864_1 /TAXON_ID=268820 /ORGANISM="Peridinium aciculiferum, Strain PAER-2" /LENGTH=64 /DNA_ID=CAMNT_0025786783 /DNA_START=102 /DNA_END=293 /DNA_ORIENTATION=-